MRLAGLDDAGRGPVIGPLVIAGVAVRKDRLQRLASLKVKDSKLLSPEARRKLSVKIGQIVDEKAFIEFSPREIDEVVLKAPKLKKLNFLEAKGMAELISRLRPSLVYVDASDVDPERFAKQIQENLPFRVKIVSEHHADRKYPVVSAASILAKVRRDESIRKLKEAYGDFGSLPYSERVLTVDEGGRVDLRPVGEIVEERLSGSKGEGLRVFSLDPSTLKVKPFEVTDYVKHAPQRIYRVVLANGEAIEVSPQHSLFKLEGVGLRAVKLEGLRPGDLLAAASRINLDEALSAGWARGPALGKSVSESQRWLRLFFDRARPPRGLKISLRWGGGTLVDLTGTDLRLIKVSRIEDTGRVEPVYDLEVKPGGLCVENFLGGSSGVIFHNSGYASDPKTVNFLKKWYKAHGSFPPMVRASWRTLRRIKEEVSQSKLV
ncbi:TPA: ribonuclease HII [Candidatus Bathyarchaeota archaeon]|nr:ribonuclease HII [Candidatus Bathyarchaeota archaeon]